MSARCGCHANAPEADPARYACPCGEHCTEPECITYKHAIEEHVAAREEYLANQAGPRHKERAAAYARMESAASTLRGIEARILHAPVNERSR